MKINIRNILVITAILIVLLVVILFFLDIVTERSSFWMNPPIGTVTPNDQTKEQYEIYKLAAEIRQIKSDTSGSLFWLKLVALLITVGGAIGGYLTGQNQVAQKRIEAENTRSEKNLRFEFRKNIDATFQSIIQELSNSEPVLRAAAAVKLGIILQNFPVEWDVRSEREEELKLLAKQVLGASLAIEANEKVRKTITIALWQKNPNASAPKQKTLTDLKNMDLSNAHASDAYWADVDFSNADFFHANLSGTSFRRSVLNYTQFYQANLTNAVLSKAQCQNANFKLADLREADFTSAVFNENTNFERAKVYGIKVKDANIEVLNDVLVDTSILGDGLVYESLLNWLKKKELS